MKLKTMAKAKKAATLNKSKGKAEVKTTSKTKVEKPEKVKTEKPVKTVTGAIVTSRRAQRIAADDAKLPKGKKKTDK